MMEKYKFLEHTADIKFKAFGKSLNEVFENSGLALIKYVFDGKIKTSKKFKFIVKGEDLENLMYNFLEEILYFIDAKNLFPGKIKVSFSRNKKILKVDASGENIKENKGYMHVKAVTYNEMFIKNLGKKGWVAQVVLDI